MAKILLAALPVVLLLASSGLVEAQTTHPGDQVVSQDTTWSGLDVTVPSTLVVQAPATLRLQGTSLRIGERIVVEEGARLELGPLGDRPTDIGPLDAGAPSDSTGFWMVVNGTLATSGTPATRLHGIRGTGLDNLYFATGGIQVAGRADLRDAHLYDGNASLVAHPTSVVALERTTIEDMGFLGIAARGRVLVANSTLRGSVNGIMGIPPCSLTVADSLIEASLNGISDNSCPLQMRRTQMVGAINGLYLSGGGTADLQDVVFTDYTQHGIFARGFQGTAGTAQSPTLVASRILLDPQGHQNVTYDGLTLQNAAATLRDSTIRGNTGSGILHKDLSTLAMENVTVIRNGLMGLFSNGAHVAGDLLAGNDFGVGTVDANFGSPILVNILARGLVLDESGQALHGSTLTIFGKDSKELSTSPSGNDRTVVETAFTAYAYDAQGNPTYLGPFTYSLSNPKMGTPQTGVLDLLHPAMYAQASPSIFSWGSLMGVGLAAFAGALILAGVFWGSIMRLVGRRRKPGRT